MELKTLGIVTTVALLGASGAASAQMDFSPYVGAGAGQSEYDVDGDEFGAGIGIDDDNDTAWRVFAGTRMQRYFGVELGYTDFGEATGTAGASAEAQGVDLAAVGFLPLFAQGPHTFELIGKAGGYWWDSEVDNAGVGSDLEDGDDFDWTAGAGVQYTFSGFQTGSLGVRAEWQRYNDIFSAVDNDVWMGSVIWQF